MKRTHTLKTFLPLATLASMTLSAHAAVTASTGTAIAGFDFHGHTNGGVQSGDPTNTDGLVISGFAGSWGTLPAANTSATQRQGTSGAYTFTFNVGGAEMLSAWRAANDTNVRSDYYYINNPARYSGPVPWRLEGLTAGTSYDLILFSRANDRDGLVSVTGFDAGNGVGAAVTLDTEGDANFSGVVADGSGQINGFFDTPSGTDAPLAGVLVAELPPVVAIPEPSTTALLGLSGLALMLRRRK